MNNETGGSAFTLSNSKISYDITFHDGSRNVGRLDFNGGVLKFEGQAEESAQVFFDYLAERFASRLKEERENEREACADVCDRIANLWPRPSLNEGWRKGYVDGGSACRNLIRERGEE